MLVLMKLFLDNLLTYVSRQQVDDISNILWYITICLCRLADFCKKRATEKRVKKDTLEIVRCASAEKQIVFARQLEQGMLSKKSKRMQRIQAEVRDLALEAEVKLKMVMQTVFLFIVHTC